MAKHDEIYVETMAKARSKHSSLTEVAQATRDKAVSEAEQLLAEAQRAHDATVADARVRHDNAAQLAHAELARTTKQAMDAWTRTERERQDVPGEGFMRRASDGKLLVHGHPGMPALASARQILNEGTWEVDTEQGRVFVGDELEARRVLWQALVKARDEAESGQLIA